MLIGVATALLVAAILGCVRLGTLAVRRRRNRTRVTITLRVPSLELRGLPFEYLLYRVREGPDSAPLINKEQPFTRVSEELLQTDVTFPLAAGLQFKCFADWTDRGHAPPSLADATALFEGNGWSEVSIDGGRKSRFWFILPDYATKDTDDVNTYRNNWLPAGPEAR